MSVATVYEDTCEVCLKVKNFVKLNAFKMYISILRSRQISKSSEVYQLMLNTGDRDAGYHYHQMMERCNAQFDKKIEDYKKKLKS